ncbi:DUF302 domain-containing protein [Thermococcus sp.]|uniref:DUF302 domain-containing protein n=1 Tax=Thermococcus sp. TaxID=35749 RepID=UPI0025E32A04|nr:DUF302 domain-containing protein [Thermococcus sp.]
MQEFFSQMVEVERSGHGFEETVERIKEAAEKNGWKVTGVLDVRESLGINVCIVEICNSKYAGRALKKPETRWVAAMMPCRFAVAENPDGVYVYAMNMGLFAGAVEGELSEVFKGISEEDRKILSQALG